MKGARPTLMSSTSTTLGWRMRATARASRRKRCVQRGSSAKRGRSIFSATRRPVWAWTASQTRPTPPAPSSRTIA